MRGAYRFSMNEDQSASTVVLPSSNAQGVVSHASVVAALPGVAEQSLPKPSKHPSVWLLVQEDFRERTTEGVRRYGVPLSPHNGRDVLTDAYQEAIDLCMYLRQLIYERDGA